MEVSIILLVLKALEEFAELFLRRQSSFNKNYGSGMIFVVKQSQLSASMCCVISYKNNVKLHWMGSTISCSIRLNFSSSVRAVVLDCQLGGFSVL